jgi:hypothetical protein
VTGDFTGRRVVAGCGRPQPMSLPDAQIVEQQAFHEAAHAVAGMASGMLLDSLQLFDVAEGKHTGSTTWLSSRAAWFDFAVEMAAGAIASVRFLQEAGLATPQNLPGVADDDERELAIAVTCRLGHDVVTAGPAPEDGATWDEVTAAAARAVDELWARITVVARALLEAPGRRLTGHQVSALTGLANPVPAAVAADGTILSRWRAAEDESLEGRGPGSPGSAK